MAETVEGVPLVLRIMALTTMTMTKYPRENTVNPGRRAGGRERAKTRKKSKISQTSKELCEDLCSKSELVQNLPLPRHTYYIVWAICTPSLPSTGMSHSQNSIECPKNFRSWNRNMKNEESKELLLLTRSRKILTRSVLKSTVTRDRHSQLLLPTLVNRI